MLGIDGPLRVLVLDDDVVFRHILVKTFDKIAGVKVVAAVSTIAAAQQRIAAGDVDIVTLDVVLGEGSGLELLPWLSRLYPHVAAVLLTAGTDKRASQTVDAILLGASSLVLKPSGSQAPALLFEALSRVVRDLKPKTLGTPVTNRPLQPVFAAPRALVALGSSTGGPPVVLTFLQQLPQKHGVPIVVTQHIANAHIASFADMLRYPGGRAVALARDGLRIEANHVYLAANNRHLQVGIDGAGLFIREDDSPEENYCRPAVDPMLRSVAESCGSAGVGVVMTGMGADGAKGALALRAKGAPVAVQDEQTSVVWGMPGAVVAAGASNAVVPGAELGPTVARWISGRAEPTMGAR